MEIVKEYTLKEIQDLSKNYSLVCVQNDKGKKLVSWTPSTKKMSVHIKECIDRVGLDIYPEGFYFFCFAINRNASKNEYDKYLYKKGNPRIETLHHPVSENRETGKDILSVTKALEYIQKIAEQGAEITALKAEVKRLTDENVVLEAELKEAEDAGLSEGEKGGDIVTYLKETGPTLTASLSEFFEIKKRQIALEEKKFERSGNTFKKVDLKRPTKRPDVVTGSDEHLNLIRNLYKDEKEILLNKELDILEKESPEKYEQICIELNLFEDESGN